MKRASQSNINTSDYWQKVYLEEKESSKQRVDDRRLEELLRWVKLRHSELGRNGSLLDAGCGLGDVGARVVKEGLANHIRYVGIDISPAAVDHCARTIGQPSFEYRVGNVQKMEFPSESFDVTWCGETLEHLDDPDSGMRELVRVTGEGGFVVISTPYRGRNRSPEHVWEFEPQDICSWARKWGELCFFDARLLEGWLTMFAVIRRQVWTETS